MTLNEHNTRIALREAMQKIRALEHENLDLRMLVEELRDQVSHLTATLGLEKRKRL